jgi:hypothetical protein
VKHIRRPCDECPWRKDAEPGRFLPERWEALRATSLNPENGEHPGLGDPLFACHKTPEEAERACAGWLAREGAEHVTVRLSVAMGHLPACSLSPGEGWPELHETFTDTMRHDLAED